MYIPVNITPLFRGKLTPLVGGFNLDVKERKVFASVSQRYSSKDFHYWFFFLRDSPFNSIRWAFAVNLSRIASARVGSLM